VAVVSYAVGALAVIVVTRSAFAQDAPSPPSTDVADASDDGAAAAPDVSVVDGVDAGSDAALLPASETAEDAAPGQVAPPVAGAVVLQTNDPQAVIAVDGVPVGQGTFRGELPIGTHDIVFSRPGYAAATRTIFVIAEGTATETVTLVPLAAPRPPPPPALSASAAAPAPPPSARAVAPSPAAPPPPSPPAPGGAGIIGSFGVLLSTQLDSMGSELSPSRCAHLGSHCVEPTQSGGGLLWSVGVMWNHFGIDVPMGITVDKGTGQAVLPPTTSSLSPSQQAAACATGLVSCAAGGPTHYVFGRVAGFLALRFRASYDVAIVRLSGATGVGVVDRAVGVAQRSSDGGGLFGGLQGGAISNYASLAYDLDLAAAIKVGATTAISVGAAVWAEDAGRGRAASLGSDSDFVLTRGAQVLVLPHVGVEFGAH
jgi:hypothetical protein